MRRASTKTKKRFHARVDKEIETHSQLDLANTRGVQEPHWSKLGYSGIQAAPRSTLEPHHRH
jgi:hypothetical protein